MAQQNAVSPFIQVKRFTRKSVFIFDHGLGDFIHYLPVHLEFERQAQMEVILAASRSRQFHMLYPKVQESETLVPRTYGMIYKVHYPDTKSFVVPFEIYDEPSKPYLCAYYELGLSPFVWTPYRITAPVRERHKRIGVHFFGHTGSNEKFCPPPIAKMIWEEIIQAGYEPFECHMRPEFRSRYADCGVDDCSFIKGDQTIRFQKPELSLMRDAIANCQYFIGVDSGPLYLATSILGHENVIGLENKKRIAYYCPKHINTLSIREYQPGSILERIQLLEGQSHA
jgi:hypothetical protein